MVLHTVDRTELADYLTEHCSDVRLQDAFVLAGEATAAPQAAPPGPPPFPPPAAPPGAAPAAPPPEASSSAPTAENGTAPKPGEAEVYNAIAVACHLREDSASLVRRLAEAMTTEERAAVCAWPAVNNDVAEYGPGTGQNGAILLRRRRHDYSLALKRVHGRLLHDWCRSVGIDVLARLPCGPRVTSAAGALPRRTGPRVRPFRAAGTCARGSPPSPPRHAGQACPRSDAAGGALRLVL